MDIDARGVKDDTDGIVGLNCITASTAMNDFTPQENAIYDRQLRVWGIHVQKRLQRAKVLVVGSNVLSAEVAKNIVLAGVGSVSLFSGSYSFSTIEDGSFFTNCHPYLNPTASCVRELQEMNPLVTVSQFENNVLSAEALKPFDVVCFTGGSLTDQVTVNTLCREAGVPFCCARSNGPFGWMFLDLLHHTYTADDEDQRERTMQFNTLQQALSVSMDNMPRKLHGLYAVLRICLEFELMKHRPPIASDEEELRQLAIEKISETPLDLRILHLYLEGAGEFAPVCSVMGGMMANEIVKIVSLKGDPVQNFLFYDIFDGKGVLHLIE